MIHHRFAAAALALALCASLAYDTAAQARSHDLQVAQGPVGNRGRGHGNGNAPGNSNTNPGGFNQGQSQGVNCANPLNAAHPNCSNNARSNAGGDLRGADRSNEVQQLNTLNGPGNSGPGNSGQGNSGLGNPGQGNAGRGRNR